MVGVTPDGAGWLGFHPGRGGHTRPSVLPAHVIGATFTMEDRVGDHLSLQVGAAFPGLESVWGAHPGGGTGWARRPPSSELVFREGAAFRGSCVSRAEWHAHEEPSSPFNPVSLNQLRPVALSSHPSLHRRALQPAQASSQPWIIPSVA